MDVIIKSLSLPDIKNLRVVNRFINDVALPYIKKRKPIVAVLCTTDTAALQNFLEKSSIAVDKLKVIIGSSLIPTFFVDFLDKYKASICEMSFLSSSVFFINLNQFSLLTKIKLYFSFGPDINPLNVDLGLICAMLEGVRILDAQD